MTDTTNAGPERPARNASTELWADYVTALGVDLPEGPHKRDELIAAADQAEERAVEGQQIAGQNTANPSDAGDPDYNTVDRSHPGADPETGRLATQEHVPAADDEDDEDDEDAEEARLQDEAGEAADAELAEAELAEADDELSDAELGLPLEGDDDDPVYEPDETGEYGTYTHQTPGE